MCKLVVVMAVSMSLMVYSNESTNKVGVAPASGSQIKEPAVSAQELSAISWARRCNMAVADWKALDKSTQRKKQVEYKRNKAQKSAQLCGISIEEWEKLSADEQKKRIEDAQEERLEKKARIWSRRCGITVDEWKKLSVVEQREKQKTWQENREVK